MMGDGGLDLCGKIMREILGGGGVNVTGYFEGNDWGYYWDGGMIGVEIFSGGQIFFGGGGVIGGKLVGENVGGK